MPDNTLESFYFNKIKRFIDYLPNLFYPESIPLDVKYALTKEPIPLNKIKSLKFKKITQGSTWGKNWEYAYFYVKGTIPPEWKAKTVVALLNFGGESALLSKTGEILQGLTTYSAYDLNFKRERFIITEYAKGFEKIEFFIEAAAHDLIGALTRPIDPIPNQEYKEEFIAKVEKAQLAIFDWEMWHLWIDLSTLFSLMKALPEYDSYKTQIIYKLLKASNRFVYSSPNPSDIRKILKPIFSQKAHETSLTAIAIGHAHIDTAWLWPLRETIKKVARTFATQLSLIEKYPSYIFGASQAQLYHFMKTHYPSIYKNVKNAVKKGRWEIQGGTWVEFDCNIPSGESIIRQFLYGKKFFKDEFNVDIKTAWLPDTFGFSPAIPQIFRHMGIENFVTQKISWSQFNSFPYTTFIWKGIDGSKVLTHFLPDNTYNSTLLPEDQIKAERNFQEKGFLKEFLVAFGIGDGGGGPTEEMIERALRQQSLAGVPKVRFGKSGDVFKQVKDKTDLLPEWYGELYLELHRGTLTSQAQNKLYNRVCENKLQALEKLYSALPKDKYPKKELEELWKIVLLNQFHDILPGSSIKEVYQESKKQYENVLKKIEGLQDKALNLLLTNDKKNFISFINTLSNSILGVFYLPNSKAKSLLLENGEYISIQSCKDGALAAPIKLNALSSASFELTKKEVPSESTVKVDVKRLSLENDFVKYQFNIEGQLISAYDKELQREFICQKKKANLLLLYQDWPAQFDAWDIDITYEQELLEVAKCTEIKIIDKGPILATISFNFTLGSSKINQLVSLNAFSRRLDFKTEVFWQERRKMFRVSFPTTIQTDFATFEVQFGAYKRNTHKNTLWDRAKFEVFGHRFVDLSENNMGIALLNNCKYGYKVYNGILDLNLLRSPFYPDPTADYGRHTFIYSILPHKGSFSESNVVEEAFALNQPPIVSKGIIKFSPICKLTEENSIKIDSIKLSEDSKGWIIRLYESKGMTSKNYVELKESSSIYECNGNEKILNKIGPEIKLEPFKIKTLLILP